MHGNERMGVRGMTRLVLETCLFRCGRMTRKSDARPMRVSHSRRNGKLDGLCYVLFFFVLLSVHKFAINLDFSAMRLLYSRTQYEVPRNIPAAHRAEKHQASLPGITARHFCGRSVADKLNYERNQTGAYFWCFSLSLFIAKLLLAAGAPARLFESRVRRSGQVDVK